MSIWNRNRLSCAAFAATALMLTGMAGGSAAAQDGELTPVCIEAFETAPDVAWLTDEEIESINQAEQDPAEPPIPEIVGYPDPETGSCATENGELREYNPDVYTLICLPSGPERDGPLVVQWALTHYVTPESDLVLADPETGACPGDEGMSTGDEDASSGDEDTRTGDDSGDVSELPSTGAGAMAENASGQAASIVLLAVAAILSSAGIVTYRSRAI